MSTDSTGLVPDEDPLAGLLASLSLWGGGRDLRCSLQSGVSRVLLTAVPSKG